MSCGYYPVILWQALEPIFLTGVHINLICLRPSCWADQLQRDANLAHLSGLCYLPPPQLQPKLETLGLTLVAEGRTHFTRWYVADRIPGSPGGEAVTPSAAGAAPDSAATGQALPTARSSGGGAAAATSEWAAAGAVRNGSSRTVAQAAPPQPGRYVFMRGVSWSSAGSDRTKLWSDLVRCWPTPFQEQFTRPAGALVAHSGVAEMATDLWQDLEAFIARAPGDVHFAGHSLGGSLSLLLTVMSHLRLGMPGQRMTATTFGSPPVLSLRRGEDGDAILEALGMAPSSVRNYVLDNDPVPRALLSVDPTFEALKAWMPVKSLLELRERLLGPGAVLSTSRFLYHTVGPVYLIRWLGQEGGGHSVLPLSGDQIQEHLKLDVEALRAQPMRLAQALMDHHHGSYAQELRAAAASLARRSQQQQQAAYP
ncbi:hypothetical protein N2152v2_005831 [Parachlorella kessleri]